MPLCALRMTLLDEAGRSETQDVPQKRPDTHCVCVCVCVERGRDQTWDGWGGERDSARRSEVRPKRRSSSFTRNTGPRPESQYKSTREEQQLRSLHWPGESTRRGSRV
eukprot:1088804-Rhodomonas_salina.1